MRVGKVLVEEENTASRTGAGDMDSSVGRLVLSWSLDASVPVMKDDVIGG